MKRVVSFLLTVALLFGMIGTTGIQVFADTPELDVTTSARLGGLPQMAMVGAAQIPEAFVERGDCYVTDVQWMTRDKVPVTTIERDQYYYLAITLETDTHVFNEEYMDTYGWGLKVACQEEYEYIDSQKCIVYYIYRGIYAPDGFTESAIVYMDQCLPGDPIPAVPQITVSAGTVSNLKWIRTDGEEFTATVFEEGEEYTFSMTLTAPEGYPFAPDAVDYEYVFGGIGGGGISYEDDFMSAELHLDVRPNFDRVGSARVAGLPWDAEAGPATAPAIYAEDDHITVGRVFWTDMEKNPVDTLENGKTYYLAFEVFPVTGCVFSDGDYTDIYTDARAVECYDRISRTQFICYCYYSLEQDAGSVTVDMSGLAEGASIADFTPVVSGKATLKELKIRNLTTGQYVTDGVFEPQTNYRLDVVLEPLPGYQFDNPDLHVIPYRPNSYGFGFYTLEFDYYFSTCQIVEEVEVDVVPPVPGGKISDAVPSVDPDAPYTIKDYYWLDSNWNEVGETFEAGKDYDLLLTLSPKAGYAFDEGETSIYINGDYEPWSLEPNGVDAHLSYTFTFGVQRVYLDGLPYSIKAGTAKVPTVEDAYKEVTVSQTRWVNSSKNKVTSFADGKVYYLELTLAPQNGKLFDTQLDPEVFLVDGVPAEWKYNSAKELVLYFRYSLEPEVGKVTVTPSKLSVGTDVSKITASVSGNVTLVEVSVQKRHSDEAVTGKLEENENYVISYTFAPKSGYRLSGNTQLTWAGEDNVDYWVGNNYLGVTIYYSTCQRITEVQVTLEGVEVGKDILGVQAIVPEGAPYSAYVNWYDVTDGWNTATGKFQDQHKYEATIYLDPKEGYVFDREVKLTINGETDNISTYEGGTYINQWKVFSFLKKVETVQFPALPTSIKKGQTLPTDFAAPADAPYTITAQWGIAGEDTVTTVSKNAPYVLFLYAVAKPGYEFSERPQVYIDGQLSIDYIPSGENELSLYRLYNVGMTEIDRVDITLPVPTAGAKPTDGTVSSTAKYKMQGADWGYNTDGDLLDIDSVNVFEKDTYVFYSPVLFAKDGYVFSEDVQVYINGVKYESFRSMNVGTYLVTYHQMGQVGDQPVKLEAPKVSVVGNTLTWEDNGAASYEVYRATSKSGKYTLLETVTAQEAAAYALRTADLTFVDETAAAGKTYYYKVKAISAAGTKYNSGYSGVSSVAYAFDAPTISVENDETTGKTVITWEKISGAKSYDVYRATEENGTYTKLGNTTSNTYTDTKAPAGTTYYYKVVTVGSSSVYNSEGSNVTVSYAYLAQPVLKATVDKATGKPALSWAAVADATGYRIFRQLPDEAGFALLSTQTELGFIDTTAPLDTLCTYYIQAVGAEEEINSIPSNIVTATVALGVPALQGNVNVFGQPSFHWQLIEGAVKYEIYRSTSSTKGFVKIDTKEDGNAFCDETAVAGTTYYYKVVALGQVSKSGESTAIKLTATCAVPEANNTIDQKTGRPMIYWETVDGAKSYDVYYATSATGTFKKLGNTKSTSYIDTKISVGATRYYKVRAVGKKSAANSSFGQVMTGMCFCASPAVKISVDTVTGKPTLSWGKVTGASSYRIFRVITGVESDFVELTSVTGTSFKDMTAPTDARCAYMVQAMHKQEGLSSAFSPVVEAVSGISRPAFKGSIDAATGAFCLTWDAVEGAVKYEIYRSTSSKKGFTLVGTVEGLTFEDPSAPGKTYYYKVIAVGQVSKCSDPTALKLVGKCAQTTASAETDLVSGKPVITWEAVSGAKKYEVYRATSETGKYSKVGTATKLSYTDTKATVGNTYYYKVVAMGSSTSSKSAMSDATQAVAVIPAQPVVTLKNDAKTGKLIASWKKVSGATQYKVAYVDITEYLENEQEPTEEEILEKLQYVTTTKTSLTIPGTEPGRMYVVLVMAAPKNEEYSSIPSDPLYGVAACAAPSIKGTLEDGKPAADWKAVVGAEIYLVYRSTRSTKGFEYIGWVDGPDFVDTSAVKGKTYYYKVTAVCWVGEEDYMESAFSNVIKVKSK